MDTPADLKPLAVEGKFLRIYGLTEVSSQHPKIMGLSRENFSSDS